MSTSAHLPGAPPRPRNPPVVLPQTFTMIFVSYFLRNGMSLSMNTSMPGFWRPMAFNMPPYTSAILRRRVPRPRDAWQPPLSPRRPGGSNPQIHCIPCRSRTSRTQSITGFLSSTPARFTLRIHDWPSFLTFPHMQPLPIRSLCSRGRSSTSSARKTGPSLQTRLLCHVAVAVHVFADWQTQAKTGANAAGHLFLQGDVSIRCPSPWHKPSWPAASVSGRRRK